MSSVDYQFRAILANIIATAWDDSNFLASLQSNPIKVLNEYGLHPPTGLKLSIYVDTPTLKHIIGDPQWVNKFGKDFLNKTDSAPKEALALAGHALVENVDYKIVFQSNNLMNIVVPTRPTFNECAIEKIR